MSDAQAIGLEAIRQATAQARRELATQSSKIGKDATHPDNQQELDSDSLKNDVTGVTVLPASNDAALGGNTPENPNVTRVTEPEDKHAEYPSFPAIDARPVWACYSMLTEWPRKNGKKCRPGVYYHGVEQGESGPVAVDVWLCTPLFVDAIASNGNGHEFGRLLVIEDRFKHAKNWCMPMSMLAGAGEDLRRELLGMGWEVNHKDRGRLPDYLFSQHPKTKIKAVGQVGWSSTRTAFVTPTKVIGKDKVFYQSQHPGTGGYSSAGTSDNWKREVAALAEGNPVLMLAIGVALAGPLLAFLDMQGGGVHLFNDSSSGKTTAADVACSVWGSPESFRKSWLATGNGLEGIAALRNDTCLVLDEISEADPRTVGNIVYAICNGTGKQRSKRDGTAADTKQWRVMMLSTGEKPLDTVMAEASKRTTAGQSIRLPSLSVARAFGAFDDLHHFNSGAAMSDYLQTATKSHFGHAGPAFIEALIQSPPITDDFRRIEQAFKTEQGQTTRVGKRFALIAYACELGVESGVLPWQGGVAIKAMLELFTQWCQGQKSGNHEQAAILQSIREFLEAHGEGQFTRMDGSDEAQDKLAMTSRAGWYERDEMNRRGYRFSSTGLKQATESYDVARVLRALIDARIWPSTTRRAEQKKIQGEGNIRLWPPIYLEGLQDEA